MVLGIGGLLVGVAALAIAWPTFRRERSTLTVEAFRRVRLCAPETRAAGRAIALQTFAEGDRVAGTSYVAAAGWCLDRPVPFDEVRLNFSIERRRPIVDGRSRLARRMFPKAGDGTRLDSYSNVLSAHDSVRPHLWWDSDSYDLVSFVSRGASVEIGLSLTNFFSMVDVCEAVAHESVAAALVSRPRSRLKFRSEIGNPFDFDRRPFLPAISTLVLLQEPSAPPTFYLLNRDAAAVASAGGSKHVFGGQFQPSSRHSTDPGSDADMWRSVARELAEETLRR